MTKMTASEVITIDPIETVTVEASPLVDWARFALVVAIFLGVLRVLDQDK